jgi:zinc transport system ATP-binding protein
MTAEQKSGHCPNPFECRHEGQHQHQGNCCSNDLPADTAVAPTRAKEPTVVLSNVSFSYDQQVVLQNVNLKIVPRDISYIVGPNGGGKSTLLKLILGMLSPDSGTISVLGDAPANSRHRIGYVPQQANLDTSFPISVEEIILSSRASRHLFSGYNADDKKVARKCLTDVKLENFAARPFAALSGGERQRVLIARALCAQPEILLLDEPMAHIDYATSDEVHHLLHRLATEMHVILVSHQMDMVCSSARSAICVNRSVQIHPTSILGDGLSRVEHDRDCTGEEHDV